MHKWILMLGLALAPTVVEAQETDAAKAATYQAAAKATYEKGRRALAKDDYLDAAKYFNQVRARFSYSQYAPLAELGLGDVYYAEDKFATAIEQYRGFIKLHPSHPEVPYAAWRVALSFAGQVPEDWFFMPPAYEKEQARTRDAERELKYFLAKYPGSRYEAEAKKRLSKVRRLLADHELYVAEFYIERDNHRAGAARLTGLLKDYSGLGLDARALFLLARCYISLGDMAKGKTALEDLVKHHPNDPLAGQARDYMAKYRM
jgi:outer membrane protein assembly factor BamD